MDISQYKDLFITEAQEHLDALNKFMLELENDPTNLDALTEIFRSAHTLKGMSATMGYDQLTELAHEMENLLEHLRTGDIPVTTPVVDTLFSCFDTLGAIINAIAEDRPEEIDYNWLIGEIRSVIEGFSGGERQEAPRVQARTAAPAAPEPEPAAQPTRDIVAGKEEPQPSPQPAFEEAREAPTVSKPDGEEARREPATLEPDAAAIERYSSMPGMRLLRLTVVLDSGCMLKSVRVFMVFKKLAQLGEVIVSLPTVEALEDEKFENSFQVLFATREVPDRIERSLLATAEISAVTHESIVEPEPKAGQEPEEPRRAAPGREHISSIARKTQSVRVNIGRLDTLMNLVGEIVINKTRLASIAAGFNISELREALDQTARLTAELQDEVMKTRMVPVEQIFNRFPRMVRDLARDQGKEIDFIVEGKEIELDRIILDEISDPLMHMIRNAVDHGIATPEERKRKGKPKRGVIKLCAYRDRNYVAIEVEDDGDGIEADRVFDKARQKELITDDERRHLTRDDLLRVISLPGFSTSEQVSGVSGRGVGMDAVKARAESLGGFVILAAEPPRGTRITIKLPLTLAIVQALMVEVSGETYAVPLGTVRETHVIGPEDIRTVQNQEAIFVRNETIPLLRLDAVLGCERRGNGSEPFPVVITEMGTRLIAIGVHSLIGQQEIVISTLDKFLKKVDGFAGATILGTGRVALILDIPSLM